MPLYAYKCSGCEAEFDELRSVAKRKSCKCPKCGERSAQQLTAARLDYYNMGCSASFPTAYQKWEKMHVKEAQRESD